MGGARGLNLSWCCGVYNSMGCCSTTAVTGERTRRRVIHRVCHEHGAQLLRTATLLAGDRTAGEDLLQGVLERTYRRCGLVQRAASPQAYVHGAMLNAARGGWRARRRHRVDLVERTPDLPVAGGQHDATVRHVLLSALGELSRRQGAVIVLRYFADQSEADVARLLGCSVGTVKAQRLPRPAAAAQRPPSDPDPR